MPAAANPSALVPTIEYPAPRQKAWLNGFAAVSLILAGVAAYHNGFSVPFLFDDDTSIFNNPSIRHLWPMGAMLSPPSTGAPVTGRPLVNVSLAVNYALGGLGVGGYHMFNLGAHLLGALTLFAIIRRTLLQPVFGRTYEASALPLAWLASLLWLVHPLLTEPVTYITGRTEVLMGLFYLATLYSTVRAAASTSPLGWEVAAFLACLAGMATKEVMVSAPLMVFLYDRTFLAGSFGAAWKERRNLYLGLAATWGLLFWLMANGGWGTRGGSTGFGGGIAWWDYLLTQFCAIVRYLRLSVWPNPLILDYGSYLERDPAVIVPCGLLVIGLGAASIAALWRKPALGFLGVWFFAILAPSSSVVPVITQTIAERRMYLALPAVTVLIVLALYRGLPNGYLAAGIAVAVALVSLTVARNRDYRSAISIWEDTVAKWPLEPRPHVNLGLALMSDHATLNEATRQFEDVIRLKPDFEMAYCCLGSCLALAAGREEEAEIAFKKELSLEPKSALGHLNYGLLLSRLPGRERDALGQLQTALTMQTADASIQAQAHSAYGSLLLKLPGRRAEGLAELHEAIGLFPDLADAHAALGAAEAEETGGLAQAEIDLGAAQELNPNSAEIRIGLASVLARIPGRQTEAISAYEQAIALNPDSWQAHYNLGKQLLGVPGRTAEGIAHLETVVRLAPNNGDAHTNLGIALSGIPGRFTESVDHFEAAARLRPDEEDVHFNLGAALAQIPNRQQGALREFQAVLRLNVRDADAHYRIGCILAGIPGKSDEAVGQFEDALSLKPDFSAAHYGIAALLQASSTRLPEAIGHLKAALRISPDDVAARDLLSKLSSIP